MPLTSSDLWNLVAQNFGDLGPGAVATMYGIVNAESGGNQYAHNPNDPFGGSYGLAQINGVHGFDPNKLVNDPAYNLAAARQVYNQQGFNAWSTYQNGAYAGRQGAGMAQVTYPAMQTYMPGRAPQPYPPGDPYSGGGQSIPPLDPMTLAAISQATGLDTGSIQTLMGQALQQRAMDTLKWQQGMALGPAGTTGVYPAELTGGQPGQYMPTMGALDLLRQTSGPADFLKYGAFANQLLGNQPGAENPWLRYNADFRGGGASTPTATAPSQTAAPQVPSALPSNLFNAQPQHDATLAAGLAAPYGTPTIQGQGAEGGLNGFMNQARQQAGVPQLAFGGQSNMAVVGDPQHGQQANPELAISASPISVVPMNQMPDHLQQLLSGMPHMATGGMIDAPFFQRLKGGGPAFSGSGLGEAWGQQPFSYRNYQQLAPSEQQMLQGYVDTPKQLGGLGGYFPDELDRARKAAFLGSPYQTFYGARGETYG